MPPLGAKRLAILIFVGASLIMTLSLSAHAADGWPLRNGDFSRDQFRRQAIHPDWRCHWWPSVRVWREDRDPAPKVIMPSHWRPSMLNLESERADRPAVLWQDVWLLPGDYVFHIEAQAVTSPLAVSVGANEAEYSEEEWGGVAVSFSVEKAGEVRVQLKTAKPGLARVRKARIDVGRLNSSAVALDGGRTLGAIVLPEDATDAEQYAAWVLQKYIFQMTGKTPGVTGRDETANGVRALIGRAAGEETLARLDGLDPDAYIMTNRQDAILLAGNNDRGTLYAVYDFLKKQGCGWYWPGPSGEVVPQRRSLRAPDEIHIESPDFLLRGLDNKRPDWDHASWRTINEDDYIDWCVRNRMNALLASQHGTIDFGQWRGGSYVLRTNHTMGIFWWKDGKPINPEWAPLVAGQRKPLHNSKRRNNPCTSNQALRDHVAQEILAFFREYPEASIFGVNVDDGDMNWCECAHCRAQDPDQGKGAWKTDRWGTAPFPMTDRWLNFINEVAARVAEVCPDKLIETYNYGIGGGPPKRERVHPNVMIRVFLYPGESPAGVPLRDHYYKINAQRHRDNVGWRNAGAQHLAFYDYDNYRYPDTVFTKFYHLADSLRTFHNDWGVRNYLSEQHQRISAASYMAHNVRAHLLWECSTDYPGVIREVCDQLYGPVSDTVYAYYRYMDQVVLDYWRKPFGPDGGRRPFAEKLLPSVNRYWAPHTSLLTLQEYSFADMSAGQTLLDKAWDAAAEDATLRARLARLRFGHAMSTLVLAVTADHVEERTLTRADEEQARAAWQLAKSLRSEYGILGGPSLSQQLESLFIAPRIHSEIFSFPVEWMFRKDPENKGLEEKWYQQAPDKSWVPIKTDQFWTHQPQGKGYHGAAWYAIEFDLSDEARKVIRGALREAHPGPGLVAPGGTPLPALHFGAVDGYADIFLDGVKIGERKKSPGQMWNRPFLIHLPENAFAREGKHRLVVRVEKDSHAAGIWKPVQIVTEAK